MSTDTAVYCSVDLQTTMRQRYESAAYIGRLLDADGNPTLRDGTPAGERRRVVVDPRMQVGTYRIGDGPAQSWPPHPRVVL